MNKARQKTPAQELKLVARARKFAAGARALAAVPHPADCPRPGQLWFDRLTDEVLTVKCLAVQEAVVSWTVVCETAGGVLLSFALAGWFRKIVLPGLGGIRRRPADLAKLIGRDELQGKVARFVPAEQTKKIWTGPRVKLDVGSVPAIVTVTSVRKTNAKKKGKKK